MSLIRLFFEVDLSLGGSVALGSSQTHYLGNVMRLKRGDSFLGFNGVDGEWKCTIERISRGKCEVTISEKVRELVTGPDLWLLFAPVKRTRIDFIASRATELGVSVLQPVFTEYTSVSRVNSERLRANAIEAAEQCGAMVVPEVREVQDLSTLIETWPSERRLILCDSSGEGSPIKSILENNVYSGPWAILVGPEGGFCEYELDQIHQKANPLIVSLGPRILRSDTAVVAALTCWQAVLGDWSEIG